VACTALVVAHQPPHGSAGGATERAHAVQDHAQLDAEVSLALRAAHGALAALRARNPTMRTVQVRAAFPSVPAMLLQVPEGSLAAELDEVALAKELRERIQRATSLPSASAAVMELMAPGM
jgi:hypothetical protein